MRAQGDASRAVRHLLRAAAEVAHDPALVARLVRSTGLSAEGVRFALERSLELDATDAEVAALVAHATRAPAVHVVLSANVFTAPLRAIALARASSDAVTVRPSTREPVFAAALVAAAADPSVTLAESRDVGDVASGEIHVYGRDETIVAVRRAARPAVVVRGHGTGLGVALVLAGDGLDEAARAIAEDVVAFDQRGCLSPRIVLTLGDAARAGELGRALHRALEELGRSVPRGELDVAERRDAARYAETMAFAGHVHRAERHLVGVATEAGPLLVPPPGRHVHIVAVSDVAGAQRLLGPIHPHIVAVGTGDADAVRSVVGQRVRVSPLGWMQRPRLDGPVDLRAIGPA